MVFLANGAGATRYSDAKKKKNLDTALMLFKNELKIDHRPKCKT